MNWVKQDIPQELVREIAAKYACDPLIASILVRRGLISGEDIRYFLEDDPRYLHNAFELPNMEDAVDRILAAKEEGENILVFGDRDVDGITSTAMVVGYLRRLGMDVTWRLPRGDEPYGLSIPAVEEFASGSGKLIITVDCGVSNVAEVKRANELGVDVIITDHHNPQDDLPAALAIVNPKLKDSRYPFRDLAGCGVAYKLVSALRFALKSRMYGQSICLFNTHPVNGAYIIEIAKLRNLAVIDRITETVVPDMVDIARTRIPSFLEGQQILVWDERRQKLALSKIFGKTVDMQIVDIADEIGKEIPQTAGKSLLRLKELSSFARYSSGDSGELDVFITLFTSFIQKRERHFTEEDVSDLQLACLGTIADIMPLVNENRIIIRAGLMDMQKKPRSGLSDLLIKLDLAARRITAHTLSWTVCPAVNAAGRMGSPEKAAQLLLEEQSGVRFSLANEIYTMNEERKRLGAEIWTFVEPMAAKNLAEFNNMFAVAYGKEIFRGVTGIMANRMNSFFKTPSLAASFSDDTVTGSLRSARGGYDLTPLLDQCADLFIDRGGHDHAAGFSMDKRYWEPFLERLKTIAQTIEYSTHGADVQDSTVTVDAELPLSYLTPDIFKVIDRLEPFGAGNDQLTFITRKMKVQDIQFIGKNGANHVRITLDTGKYKWPAVYWNAAERVKRDFDVNDAVDAAFHLNRNWYNGMETPQMVLLDVKRSEKQHRTAPAGA
ncbi:MAG: single-stranded-DNA-specific exonuclease RecJ [Treponema sp.]|jgi:single-stranded-DNA-specific exonuclease|nr:single-stranded-DNA-specific exonuclease RecJ [Treponema sp.]